jgi:RHH-type transcriptional regulator, rel operon repressor / antitoxin RelB
MLAIRLDKQTEYRIDQLSKTTKRPKSYYIREALSHYLDDIEDTYMALYRLEHPAKIIALEDVINEFKTNAKVVASKA